MRDLVPFTPADPCDDVEINPFDEAACEVRGELAELGSNVIAKAGQSAFESLTASVVNAAAEVFTWALKWWVTSPTLIDPSSTAVHSLQDYTQPVVVLILMISVLAQGIRMIISRKKDPAVDVGVGLVRFAVISMLGLMVLAAALAAADGLARSIMESAVPQFIERMNGFFEATEDDDAIAGQTFLLFFFALVIFVLSLVQWILGFFRQAGILVLAAMIPLAASGSVNRSTRPWMSKLTGWLIALVAYKPMAAFIYAIGLQLMSETDDLAAVITGVMVLALAVLALPAMLRFFQWSGAGSGGGGGAAGVLAAGATGAIALNQIGGGGSANQQADSMNRSGPQTAPTGAANTGDPGQRSAPPSPPKTGDPRIDLAVAAADGVRKAPGKGADKMTGEG